MAFIHFPRLAAIHQDWLYQCLKQRAFGRPMILLLQIFFNLKNTPFAVTTLLWMSSSVPPPSLETVALRYMNRSTSSIPCPFTSSLHLSTLAFSPTFSASWVSLPVLV